MGETRRINKNLKIDTRSGATVTLCTWTGDISHLSDGTLELAVSASFSMSGTSLSGGSLSGSISLPNIPRASSAVLSASSVNPGGSITFTVNSADSSFSHKLTFKTGSHTQTVSVAAGVSSYVFGVPQGWAEYLTDARKSSVAVTLSTYSGSTILGSKQYSFTLSIPDNSLYRPEFDIVLTRLCGDALADTGEYVKGKSRVRVDVDDVSCKYGAVRKEVFASVCSVKKSLPAEFSLTSSGTVTVSVTLKDSRGLSTTVSQVITVCDYSEPTVGIVSAARCDSRGEYQSSGTYLAVEYETDVSAVNGGNSGTVSVCFKAAGDSQFGAWQNVSDSPAIIGGNIQNSSSYLIKMRVSDTVSGESEPVVFKVPSEEIAFNLKKGGKGAAFGCFAETENELTVGYDLRVNGTLFGYDLSDEFSENESYISDCDITIKYYKCIETVIFSGRFTVGSTIPAGQTVYLGSVSEHFPQRANSLCAFVNGNSENACAHMRADGRLGFRCAENISADKKIYINGFWFNNTEAEEV